MHLVLQAKLVPLGTKVTKPTGTKEYVLKREIPIFGKGAEIVTTRENIMFMVADGAINIIDENDLVAVHFGSTSDLSQFVYIHLESHQ